MVQPTVAAVATAEIVDNVGATQLACAKPTGTVANNVLLAVLVGNGSLGTITAPTGWTLKVEHIALANPKVHVYEKLAGSSEPADYTFSWVNVREAGLAISRVIDADTTDWWDSDPTFVADDTSATSITHGGVTTTVADTLIVGGSAVNSSTRTLNPPTGYTEHYENGERKNNLCSKGQAVAGATGTVEFTFSGTATGRHAWLGAMKGTTGGASHPLDGAAVGTSAAAASRLTMDHPLAGGSVGASSAAATRLVMDQPLAGSAAGVAAAAATRLTMDHPLAGGAAGSSMAAALRLMMDHPLTGGSVGTSAILASLAGMAAALEGAAIGTSAMAALRLSLAHPLAGSAAGESLAAAIRLVLAHPLAGAASGVSAVSGDLTVSPGAGVWSHVGTTKATGVGSASPALPVGTQAGDLIIVLAAGPSGNTPPSGYTVWPSVPAPTNTFQQWSKLAVVGEPSPVVTGNLITDKVAAICAVFRGAAGASPVADARQTNILAVDTFSPAITAPAGALVVHGIRSSTDGLTHTPPAAFTEPANGDVADPAFDTLAFSYRLHHPAGSTGAVAGALSATASSLVVIAAFAPTAEVGSGPPLSARMVLRAVLDGKVSALALLDAAMAVYPVLDGSLVVLTEAGVVEVVFRTGQSVRIQIEGLTHIDTSVVNSGATVTFTIHDNAGIQIASLSAGPKGAGGIWYADYVASLPAGQYEVRAAADQGSSRFRKIGHFQVSSP